MTSPHKSDPPESFLTEAKRRIRRSIRQVREALPESSVTSRSGVIVERLLCHPLVREAKRVALFYPMAKRREIDLRGLHEQLRERGAALYYPFMQADPGGTLTGFRRADELSQLCERGRGFAEPPLDAAEARRGELDLVIVPALAAAPSGHRLGYGAGFYDATLPDVCPPARSIVVVFDFQLLVELPVSKRDVACDVVVTDAKPHNPALSPG